MHPHSRVTSDHNLNQARVLRRYLDLPKYLDLLRTRHLYFRRADKFNDRFEGALTPSICAAFDQAHAEGLMDVNAEEFRRRCRESHYVNCWTKGAKDNMALWQIYGGATNSVAITTTVGRLIQQAWQWDETVHIEEVKYIDHFQNPDMIIGGRTEVLKYKHLAYKFENELRVLIGTVHDDDEENPLGVTSPVGIVRPISDLNAFIRTVVVAPEAEDWFYELVVDVTRKYGVKRKVNRSQLTHLPR